MDYFQYEIQCKDISEVELALAYLSELPFEAFEEKNDKLIAWVQKSLWFPNASHELDRICIEHDWSYNFVEIENANWNKAWEDNFEPVRIENLAIIRAPFHNFEPGFAYDILIQPRMSFGTGHHATTRMMLESIHDMDLTGKNILDFGCGTGILAIFAALKKGQKISGIDNEAPAVENSIENARLNHIHDIYFSGQTLAEINQEKGPFDIILGNIQLNVLRNHAGALEEALSIGGILLASGVLIQDQELLKEHFADFKFKWIATKEEAGWCCIWFERI